jgi:sigma-E factor negative regulatory protein RseA
MRQEHDMTHDISSLMDGELGPQEVDTAIRAYSSTENEERWYLYHVIGETMRGQPPRRISSIPGIRSQLQQEPAIIARPKRVPETTFGRIALAAAASVATIGVVGWIGTQGGQSPAISPIAKNPSAIQAVSNRSTIQVAPADVQDYLAAHRQLPSPELYRPVNNRAPAAAR